MNLQRVVLRPAMLPDVPAIARIHVDTWRSAYKSIVAQEYLDSLSYAAKEQEWNAGLDVKNRMTRLVAEVDGNVVGFITIGPSNSMQGFTSELYALYVSSDAQRSGIGKALFDAGLDTLKEHGHSTAIVWVLADNLLGRSFYEKQGGVHVADKLFELAGKSYDEVAYGYELI